MLLNACCVPSALTGLAIGAHRKRPDPPGDTATGQSISKTLADRPIVVQSGCRMSPASGRFLLIALASGQPWRADAFGAPSKKNATGTCRIWDICCNRLAPMRFVPFSYFCTCWNVSDSASPSFSWLIPSIMRRILTRLPTCLSMGLGAFFVIYSVLLSFSPRFAPDATSKTGAIGDDPGRPYVQNTC